MDETIDDDRLVIFRDGSEEMDACNCNAAECPWFRQVGCITVDVETHVGSCKLDFGVWVGGQIIQQLVGAFCCISVGLACSEARDPRATRMVLSTARPQ